MKKGFNSSSQSNRAWLFIIFFTCLSLCVFAKNSTCFTGNGFPIVETVFFADSSTFSVFVDTSQPDAIKIICQKYNANHEKQWGDGIVIIPVYFPGEARITGDGTGGAFVAWLEYSAGHGSGVRMTRLLSDGAFAWEEVLNLLAVPESEPELNFLLLLTGDEHEAFVIWNEIFARSMDIIFCSRVDTSANRLFATQLVGTEHISSIMAVFNPPDLLHIAYKDNPEWAALNIDTIDDQGFIRWHDFINQGGYEEPEPELESLSVTADGCVLLVYYVDRYLARKYNRDGALFWERENVIYTSVPEMQASPGDTLLVPVDVVFPFWEHSQFYRAEFSLSGFQDNIEFLAILSDSGMIRQGEWSAEENDTSLVIRIAATENPFSGEGLFFVIKFYVPLESSGSVDIVLDSVQFDPDWPVVTISGRVDIIPTGIDEAHQKQPFRFELSQNFPNPFNSATEIRFGLADKGFVQMDIFDVHGRNVKRLFQGVRGQGFYVISWNGKDNGGNDVASGAYLCRLLAGDKMKLIKLTMLK